LMIYIGVDYLFVYDSHVIKPKWGWEFGFCFIYGVCAALYDKELDARLLIAFSIVLLVSVLLWFLGKQLQALLILLPLLVIQFGKRKFPVIRDFGRYGDFSYGIYIYAFPVQQLTVYFLGVNQGFVVLLCTSILVTMILAVLSWHFVERQALRLKPSK